ncbi:Alpha-keto acid-binding periplasmic protein TakP [Usitatibacter rugosus]|uniref:Alpha-keto acid-binding periplasmic protein TakP n=1 Tax=Usitatibacter rugosus TaxID=2732067 RepID=A0A6M4GRK0_9PROT|nr:TRAP transporter substrate-binding protein [Usitatibacter rugosus]QJR09959.1 Alpha-keto acid-binding periplasmic protein TakP [Usitatibacter rugosus]
MPRTVADKPAAASSTRRRFLAGAGIALAGAPMVVRAQPAPITLRFQSTWPVKFLYHEFAVDFTKKVAELSNGRLVITMLPAGSVVPGLQVVEATSKGILDGGHGLAAFWFGKNTAFGLYGAGPDFGLDGNQLLAWVEYGGGKELFAEIQAAAQLDIVSLLYGPVPCEPMGWFKKPIRSVADLKGLKFRTAGLAVEMFNELGMSTVQMAPGDIVPALDRGLLDGAEFASASDDRVMGFADVAKFYLQQSYHMSNNFCEIMINKKRYESLPDDLKVVLKMASHAASADMEWKSMHRMSQDFLELKALQKVSIYRTPKPILDAQLKAWDKVIAKHSATNPLFAKVVESQKAWAKRVMYWHNEVQVDQRSAYTHWFGKGPATT